MKKRLVAMLAVGVVAVSLCACGGKKTEEAANTAEEATTQETTQASTEEAETQESEEIRVNEREDYIALEDLAVEDYLTLPEYASMTVQAVKPEVTDEVVEEYINTNILTSYPVTDRVVATGDAVKIDYVGKKDDVAFEGGTAQGYVLNIGSGTFIDGFEDGLIGVMPGETVDLNLTFPAEYHSADLAGAEVVFTVTVHEIQEFTDYASVTPEILTAMGSTYASKEELWADAVKQAEEAAEDSFEANTANAIAEKLMTESSFSSVPQHLVDEEVQNYNDYMETICMGYYGVDMETFVTTFYGTTMEEYQAQLNTMCEDTVKLYLIMEAVARAEGIEVTDEIMMEKAKAEAAEYQYESAEAMIQAYGESSYRMYVMQELVMEKLMDKVTVEMITEEEAMTQAAENAE